MSIIEAIILGIIQGLSEFIPISSTAHLTIAGDLFGLIDPNNPESWTAFIAVVQLGTLGAVLCYFYKDILNITNDFFRDNLTKRKKFKEQSTNSKMGWYVIIGSIPIVTIGLALKKILEGSLTKDLTIIASSLIGLGIVLFLADVISKQKRDYKKLTMLDGIIIGLAQCVALIPGSSRSGTTLTAGLFLGLKRDVAARFSFLLGIPAIFGSGLYEFYSQFNNLQAYGMTELAIATLFSGISGWFAIDFLLKYLKKRNTFLFAGYRVLAGVLILIFLV